MDIWAFERILDFVFFSAILILHPFYAFHGNYEDRILFIGIQSSREEFPLLAARPMRRLYGIVSLHGAVHKKRETSIRLFPFRYDILFYFLEICILPFHFARAVSEWQLVAFITCTMTYSMSYWEIMSEISLVDQVWLRQSKYSVVSSVST